MIDHAIKILKYIQNGTIDDEDERAVNLIYAILLIEKYRENMLTKEQTHFDDPDQWFNSIEKNIELAEAAMCAAQIQEEKNKFKSEISETFEALEKKLLKELKIVFQKEYQELEIKKDKTEEWLDICFTEFSNRIKLLTKKYEDKI